MSLTLQDRLKRRYDRETWNGILFELFPDGAVSILSSPAEIDVTHEQVKATRQLGHLQLADGSRVALVEVEAADTVKLARNRIALRNFIGKLIVPGSSDAVLAVFHQPGRDDWRLTYASRRTTLDPETFAVTHSETSPRRFTFLLGPGETCRTAAGRLKELEGKDKLTLDELERAFSVERLNKDFFKRYKEFYERFTTHLLSSDKADATRKTFGIKPEGDPKEQDKADKPVRDFSKKLLGRLVFLHFLQKKRWLGCPKGTTDWSAGEENFIADFFEKARADGKSDHFHSLYLTPLFFEALNTPDRKGDLFPLTGTRLPYLNGGLFEEDSPTLRALDFPPLLFEELLGFFGEYHFTIDENDPEDHEVGIDPEMLGHIFENLLEDNKDKGAFYTPKAIVQYMARESLRHYLETHLGPDPEIAILLAEKDLTRLDKNGFVKQHAKKIATLLEDVKICDPAIGSGAFPIGLLQEILWTRLTLNWELNTPEDRARLKREIIKNSIHGVDLDPGAVEIARLRFWLALVVDEEIPRPLPNLDYKIMQGDGLLESFEGIDLSRLTEPGGGQNPFTITFLDGTTELDLGKEANASKLVAAESPAKDIEEKMDCYFAETNPVHKRKLHQEIDSVVLEHLRHCVDEKIKMVLNLIDQQHKLIKGQLVRPRNWLKEKSEKRIKELEAEVKSLRETRTRLEKLFVSTARPFFLWHLYFRKILDAGGFDIFIANPPYVRADNPEALALRKKVEATGLYETLWEKWDLYVAFIERGYKFLTPGGVMSYIVSDAYCHSKFAIKSQDWFLKNSKVLRLDFLSDLKVFEAAVRNVLFFFQKADGAEHVPDRRRHRETFGDCIDLPSSPQNEATHRLFFLEDEGELQQEFEVETLPLDDLVYVSVGMVAHANEKLCKGDFKLEDLVSNQHDKVHSKKFVEGKHLDRWLPATHKWFEWGTERSPTLLRRPTFPEMYEVPEKLISVDMAVGGDFLRVAYDSDSLLHNHSAWSFVPWYSLKGVQNRSLKKQAKYRSEKPGPEDRRREDLEKLSKGFEVKYLLAVMNSSVAREWLRARRRSNIHLYPDDWKPLPIPVVDQVTQAPIVKLVDLILSARKASPNADISDLETAIDHKVKQAYGLV
jgi:Eco57I restriction-modification methylase